MLIVECLEFWALICAISTSIGSIGAFCKLVRPLWIVHARKAAKGRLDTPDYRRVMTDFLRNTGFTFLNKDDRAMAVRLLPR